MPKQAVSVLSYSKNECFLNLIKKFQCSKLGKTGIVSRDRNIKSLKAQVEESECYIKMLFFFCKVFHFILDQNLLHLKFQLSVSASVPFCSCKEGGKAG